MLPSRNHREPLTDQGDRTPAGLVLAVSVTISLVVVMLLLLLTALDAGGSAASG